MTTVHAVNRFNNCIEEHRRMESIRDIGSLKQAELLRLLARQ